MKLREGAVISLTFVVHMVSQIVLFILFFLVVLLANIFARWVESLSLLPDFMINTLYSFEYLLFGVDVLGIFIIILFEVSGFIIEMWELRPWKKG